MVRNEDWRIDIHVSRRVVFHTATLTAGGSSFWLPVGGEFARTNPGRVGPDIQSRVFSAAACSCLHGGFNRKLRLRAWRLIAENFFSHRLRYREEWLLSSQPFRRWTITIPCKSASSAPSATSSTVQAECSGSDMENPTVSPNTFNMVPGEASPNPPKAR